MYSGTNFSISNTSLRNFIQYVSNYTTGINNMGHVPDNAKVYTISNTIIASSANHNIESNSGMGSSVDSFDISNVDTSDDINTSVNYAQIPQMMMLMSMGQGAGQGPDTFGIPKYDSNGTDTGFDRGSEGTFSSTEAPGIFLGLSTKSISRVREQFSYSILQTNDSNMSENTPTTRLIAVINKYIKRFPDGRFVFDINSHYPVHVTITNPEGIVIYDGEKLEEQNSKWYYKCVTYYESRGIYDAYKDYYNNAVLHPPPPPENGELGPMLPMVPISEYLAKFNFDVTWAHTDAIFRERESVVIYISSPKDKFNWYLSDDSNKVYSSMV